MKIALNVGRTIIILSVPLPSVVVNVFTTNGTSFEASPRGIGFDRRDAAIAGARKWVKENPAQFETFRAQLL